MTTYYCLLLLTIGGQGDRPRVTHFPSRAQPHRVKPHFAQPHCAVHFLSALTAVATLQLFLFYVWLLTTGCSWRDHLLLLTTLGMATYYCLLLLSLGVTTFAAAGTG